MITPIEEKDLPILQAITKTTIHECVVPSKEQAEPLLDEINDILDKWLPSREQSFHAKCHIAGQTVGYIVVKDFWNLCLLFVLPAFQRRGIGRALVQLALDECRSKSPRRKIQLNSSTHAADFYTAIGFTQSAPALDRPGGCIPFTYDF